MRHDPIPVGAAVGPAVAVDVNRDAALRRAKEDAAAALMQIDPYVARALQHVIDEAAHLAVDAATPHLTADLVRERDEARAEAERLRNPAIATPRELSALRSMEQAVARAEAAEAAIARVEAECAASEASAEEYRHDLPAWKAYDVVTPMLTVDQVRAALRGDQP